MKKALEFKIYFYNGFNKPEIVASSIDELIKNIEIYDNYTGDKTQELIDDLDDVHWHDIEELNEVLYYYNMVINPTLEQLVDDTLRWFPANDIPYHLLTDFGTRGEIYDITNRCYDNFKKYHGYEGKYIIEDWIRHIHHDTVIDVFDTLEDAENFVNVNNLWDDMTLLGVNYEGRAFYPSF